MCGRAREHGSSLHICKQPYTPLHHHDRHDHQGRRRKTSGSCHRAQHQGSRGGETLRQIGSRKMAGMVGRMGSFQVFWLPVYRITLRRNDRSCYNPHGARRYPRQRYSTTGKRPDCRRSPVRLVGHSKSTPGGRLSYLRQEREHRVSNARSTHYPATNTRMTIMSLAATVSGEVSV